MKIDVALFFARHKRPRTSLAGRRFAPSLGGTGAPAGYVQTASAIQVTHPPGQTW